MVHAPSAIEGWRIEYHTERPHSAPGCLTPAQHAAASNEALALRASANEETIQISLTEDSISLRDEKREQVSLTQACREQEGQHGAGRYL